MQISLVRPALSKRCAGFSDRRSTSVEPMPAISPGWKAPVVRRAADGERELVTMSWNFVFDPASGLVEGCEQMLRTQQR